MDSDVRARIWPAWFYLIGVRAADKFDMRARAARVASWDRNVQTAMVVLGCRKIARDEILKILWEKGSGCI